MSDEPMKLTAPQAQFVQNHHFMISPWMYSLHELAAGFNRMLAARWDANTRRMQTVDGHPQGE